MKNRSIVLLILIFCSLNFTACGETKVEKVSESEPVYTTPKTAWEAAADSGKEIKTDIITLPPADEKTDNNENDQKAEESGGLLLSEEDISLTDSGDGSNFYFTYDDEEFHAVYTPDNWKIIDSYKIRDINDIKIICKALSEIYPIHTADGESYRTADDLAFEWSEHNRAYYMLSDDSKWKQNTKDVDLDPKDQGKTMADMAMDRINDENSDQ